MSDDIHDRARPLYLEIRSRPVQDRRRALDEACGSDRQLREAVEAELRADERTSELSESETPSSDSHFAAEAWIGRKLGAYEILEVLGQGGMGVVYLALDSRLDRRVALKVLPRELVENDARRERLRSEARLLASVNHPNIATVHSLEEIDGIDFLTMEWIDGETLAGRSTRGPVAVHESLVFGHQIASALEAVHARGVVHRDLKPQNVMIARDGRIKVVDFGIASDERDRADPAADALEGVVGTPGYMSPEQLRRDAVGPSTDVFAFACVFSELLSGRPVFGGRTPSERVQATIHGDVDRAEFPSEVGPDLESLIQHSLDPDPSRRPDTSKLRRILAKSIEQSRISSTQTRSDASLTPEVSSLPRHFSRFVGRSREIDEIRRALEVDALITITGPGGSGKSRLAAEVARAVADEFSDGTHWVDLAPLSGSALLTTTIAEAVGVEVGPQSDPTDALLQFLRSRRALIILDNCEHLVVPVAQVVDHLLSNATECRVLTTSQESLGVGGEQLVPLSPFETPERVDLDDVESFDSVALFVDRAKSASAAFTLDERSLDAIVEICRRLDGVPLAIELAAARVASLPVQEISRRLDDRFRILTKSRRGTDSRYSTLRSAVEWSHDLLEAEDKALFRHLGVFAGEFSLDAAEQVLWPDSDEAVLGLEGFCRLVDKSLVVMRPDDDDGARYRMLETIRHFARERLDESDDADTLRERHDTYYRQRARELTLALDQRESLRSLDADIDEYRVILDAGMAGRQPEHAVELAAALGRYWQIRGRWHEGRHYLTALLELPDVDERGEGRSDALWMAGKLAQFTGNLEVALRHFEGAKRVAELCEDVAARANAISGIGNIAEQRGELEEAQAQYTECLAINRELDRRIGIANSLGNLGVVAKDLGQYDEAEKRFQESLAMFRELGHPHGAAISLNNLAVIALRRQRPGVARDHLEHALEIRRELGDRSGEASGLTNLARAALLEDDLDPAEDFALRALRLKHELGDTYLIATSLENLALLAARRDQPQRALKLLCAGDELREFLGAPCPADEQVDLDELRASLLAKIASEAPSIETWARETPLADVVKFALDREA